ncbi:hypothetical protein CgunFtcFv8_010119 [Champsocephalus gunnari]|uniref:Anoctamin dimerisation domain-containing protein n=1 Tax=Champsocephalus gunnari TaxID=52237 RepID=A0AAN8DUJ5_CHAGU|nr:hypothetical protein CgunFtcFv8_010119 [Champsocephalus gunnari]
MRHRGEVREDSDMLIAMETEAEKNYGSVAATNAPVQPPDRNVFSDGSTRVDFVLVWEEPLSLQVEEGSSPAHREWRQVFLQKLRKSGLLQEQKDVLQQKTKICFVLLNAPWSVLCFYAEDISLRVPLQVVPAPLTNWSAQVLSRLSVPNPFLQDVPNAPPGLLHLPVQKQQAAEVTVQMSL